MWFQYLLVQCLITIAGDGAVLSWPSSSAGERKADYLSQQRPRLHCGNSRQMGSSWDGEKRKGNEEGLFPLPRVKICYSFPPFSARTFPPRTRSAVAVVPQWQDSWDTWPSFGSLLPAMMSALQKQ